MINDEGIILKEASRSEIYKSLSSPYALTRIIPRLDMTDPSVSTNNYIIRAAIHSSMLQSLLMGIYTVVYGGAMYLYISQDKPNRRMVIATITVMYALPGTNTIVSLFLNNAAVAAASTRGDMAKNLLDSQASPIWLVYFNNCFRYPGYLVSDAFLIWRCYHVWGMSFRVIAFPSVMLFVESALTLMDTVYISVGIDTVTSMLAAPLMLASLLTTVVTTFLIGYRIHKVARTSVTTGSRRRLNAIVTMIVESSAMYAVAICCTAVVEVMQMVPQTLPPPELRPWPSSMDVITDARVIYTQSISIVLSGLAPTLLVARTAVKAADTERTVTTMAPHMSHVS